jgi:hypothetical protein
VVILYLETNFLMSLALNQDPGDSALLEKAAQDRSLRLAIPQVCIMEAFATIRKQRPKTRLGLPIFTLATDRAPEPCVVIVAMRSLRF